MAVNITSHFGIQVRKYRRQQKLSQLKLAEMAKVDLSTINRIERGVANITLRRAFKVAKALHIPLYRFFLTDKKVQRMERREEITGEPIEG